MQRLTPFIEIAQRMADDARAKAIWDQSLKTLIIVSLIVFGAWILHGRRRS